MRLGKLILPLLALASLAFGFAAQRPKKELPYPLRVFAEAKAEDYIGEQTCADCHSELVANFQKSGHATFSHDPKLPTDKKACEGCHGPGKPHLDENNPKIISYKKLTATETTAMCLRCHNDTMAKGHWNGTAHQMADVSCTSCHQIHPDSDTPLGGKDAHPGDTNLLVDSSTGRSLVKTPVFPTGRVTKNLLKADEATLCGSCHQNQVTQFRLNTHHPVLEGRMVCSDCHSLHPSKASKKQVSFNRERCIACHGEIAGPFAYEHDPVSGLSGDACSECHKPHGSQNPRLLTGFSRGLCLKCHTDKSRNHHLGRTCWSAGCHVAMHGSNTSPDLLTP